MTADIIERDSVSRLDRSNCILPPSSHDSTSTGRATISIHIDHVEKKRNPSIVASEASLETILKVSWILTLRCFVVADIICFKYEESSDISEIHKRKFGTKKPESRKASGRYFTRINPHESVCLFSKRLDASRLSSHPTIDPISHDIGVADSQSVRHHCNTGLYVHRMRIENKKGEGKKVDDFDDVKLIIDFSDYVCSLRLDYRPSHTSHDMATSILNTFQHIYTQVANASEHTLLQDINEFSPLDQTKIKKWTCMDPTPSDSCLHTLILKQCRLRPEEMAVRSWDGDLTYRELDDLSLRLAHHLTELGVGPETFVLSCFEKSTWAIVARLAILRAGGAYISIFASNPPVYLESVITRTKTRVLVTDSCYTDRFRDIVPVVVGMSPEWLRSLPAGSRVCETIRPDNACLVLFTSGSTGTPKGIIQTHQAYATAIKNYARDLQLGPHTRCLQFDDYAFDISNLEFLVPLILGGCCCVPGPMKTVQDLSGEINALDADILFLTPTVAIKLEPSDVPRLKTMCVGGEPLPKDLVSKWDNSATKLVNQYGMGEVAICCALNRSIDLVGGAKVGRPSTGAIWVVNSLSPEKLTPIGAVGEIIIEGPHLSHGYLDETATCRTEAGFLKTVPRWMMEMHPDRTHTRMYRSGDLGRQNHDGTITYLGRKDTILKLDGCRIDALEVEHQAHKCLSDKDTVVVDLLGIINGQDEPSLTAFICLDEHPISSPPVTNGVPLLKDALVDPHASAKIKEMQASIALSLPRYMIPTTFVLMSWIPRTASKKIDRKKIHMLGQTFYFARLEQLPKDVSYAQKI
ncbi:acetyl-CoA synthetase-like protein [Daldinia caldariorum]|uniref:acetyl-CoA synthetase-like protein n=1 Tax=Daldinia caldariorum TaxID=326644 RepID=UPI00200866B0|nr:acetyl-CoA synthetase-like protein [Daldinia caldariorum]KAI1463651.1 acetyl-CoA synthetase-like protein [Daldinia caldariorum]